MRIGIDCRLGGLEHAGIGRYTQELVLRLLALKTAHTWVLFFSSQEQAQDVLNKFIDHKNVTVAICPIPHYSITEQLILPWKFYQEKLDLLHIPHFNAPVLYLKPTAITIHDLLWHEHKGSAVTTLPAWSYWSKYLLYRLVASINIWKAKKIIVPAQTIKNTVTSYYPSVKNKIIVTYEGTSLPKKVADLPDKLKTKRYLLYVGSLYPHKNIDVVLRTLQLDRELSLVIVGSRNVFQQQTKKMAKHYQVNHQIVYLGRVSDAVLATLYTHAQALMQPSLSEGFGLTGIEAMQQNCPVVASDIDIFHEIYGTAAVFFDPYDPESCFQAISSLTARVKSDMCKKAEIQLQKFSWERMAKKTLEVYET